MQLSSIVGELIKGFVSDYPEMNMEAITSDNLDDRISHLASLIDDGIQDPRIRQLASRILNEAHVPIKDSYAEIEAIYNFVKNNIRYTKDPDEYELFQKPERTLQLRIGDCDDMAILISALLMSIGYVCILRVIGVTRNQPEHIYPVVILDNEEIALDATVPQPIGYEVSTIKFSQDYEI